MTNIEKLHCQLFGDFFNPVGVYGETCGVGSDCLKNRKNNASCGLSVNQLMMDPKDLNKNNSKKSRRQKELTIKNIDDIFGDLYIYLFNYLRELKNEAKLVVKGVVFRDIRCSFPRKGVVFRDIRCSFSRKGVVFCEPLKGLMK
jgi:hypothetical protein